MEGVRKGQIDSIIILIVCWYIWLAQNNSKFNEENFSASLIITGIKGLMDSILKVNILQGEKLKKTKSKVFLITWLPLSSDSLKLNADGIVYKDTWGCGDILGDRDDKIHFAFATPTTPSTPLMAKLYGHFIVHQICILANLKKVSIELDFFQVINILSFEKSEKFRTGVDEALILKKKSEDIIPYMNERCIFLVGMMGSGKTTVGKILSEVLGYSFFDSDKLVEKAVGMYSVAQIFKERSEAFFRDNESNALRDLSLMHRLVVATGGGAVIRPINWRYMKQGITIWLDVPLEALARRIAAVGTESRPLLDSQPGDPYTKAFIRLSTLSKERGDAYANADARVCLQHIASKKGHGDVSALTPTAIAIEALVKIESFLTKDAAVERLTYF